MLISFSKKIYFLFPLALVIFDYYQLMASNKMQQKKMSLTATYFVASAAGSSSLGKLKSV